MSDTPIDSPDDIGTRAAATDQTPITDTRDIDFLRSTTKTIVDREADGDTTTRVEHLARFGVAPGTVIDMLADYSKTANFEPHWLSVEWVDGRLYRVYLSGPQRLKDGGTSTKRTRHRTWNSWGASRANAVDKADLPAPVAEAITAYETAIAVAASGGRK
jgi:hypothetical protein